MGGGCACKGDIKGGRIQGYTSSLYPHFAVSLEISKKLTVKHGILLSAYTTEKSFVFTYTVGTFYLVQSEDLDLSWEPAS